MTQSDPKLTAASVTIKTEMARGGERKREEAKSEMKGPEAA